MPIKIMENFMRSVQQFIIIFAEKFYLCCISAINEYNNTYEEYLHDGSQEKEGGLCGL